MKKKDRIGRYIKQSTCGETVSAYLPPALPPTPSIDLDACHSLLEQANVALGRLDGMRFALPDPSLFLYMYVRKEAVLSSQIEGTQSSLSDLLLFEVEEAPEVPLNDVKEVSSYVSAMTYGLDRLKTLPLSLRLIREIHEKLMTHARGGDKRPGELRTSQNWIGGSRPGNAVFVPPPPEYLIEILGDLEKFLHDDTIRLPILVKAALVHAQFETIHPFLDGNGRLGRLLITFILCAEGLLKEPLLYLSLYFKTHRQAYYHHLQSIRETGDWEAWIHFFLEGVIETAQQATQTAQSIMNLFSEDYQKIMAHESFTANLLNIYTYLKQHPITTTSQIKKACNMSLPTVLRSLAGLAAVGIVHEITGKERHKVFVYSTYLGLLSKGTEPAS